jgi:hypothetical protein
VRCAILNSGNPVARIERAMPCYQFAARTEDSQVEKLGVMDLRHDGDALSFADAIIRDLMHTHPAVYGSWTLDIVEDERQVASVAFKATSELHAPSSSFAQG